MKFDKPTIFNEVFLITFQHYNDERGLFFESYKSSSFKKYIPHPFVQDNQSISKKNVFRGFHFQVEPHEQGKLVSVINGSILDIIIDIRSNSPTYGKWASIKLSSTKYQAFWVPPGFAHGFLSLEEHTKVFYKVTKEYSKQHEHALSYLDPVLKLDLLTNKKDLIVSEKDQKALFLHQI